MRISVPISDATHLKLTQIATQEHRSISAQAALLLTKGVEEEPLEPAAGLEEPTGTAAGSSGATEEPPLPPPAEAAPPAARKTKKRTAMCEHRIPADQFCKRCDDA